ncbi:Uncharacterised protein [Enterobacter asburiae]|uniref:Uncharacterized protein n=1 Tax=Enterobacter asburiae TaxID=61645 RepID=A0A376F4I0_ENTAS|nr:Uncharacterised protein [Enterobacter asburiae]
MNIAPPVKVTDNPTSQLECVMVWIWDRHGHAEQPEGQNGDKASDKNGAIRRVRFQQAEVEQPGFFDS